MTSKFTRQSLKAGIIIIGSGILLYQIIVSILGSNSPLSSSPATQFASTTDLATRENIDISSWISTNSADNSLTFRHPSDWQSNPADTSQLENADQFGSIIQSLNINGSLGDYQTQIDLLISRPQNRLLAQYFNCLVFVEFECRQVNINGTNFHELVDTSSDQLSKSLITFRHQKLYLFAVTQPESGDPDHLDLILSTIHLR